MFTFGLLQLCIWSIFPNALYRYGRTYQDVTIQTLTFPYLMILQMFKFLITVFALVGGVFQLVFLWNFIHSMFYGKKSRTKPMEIQYSRVDTPVEHMHGNWPGAIPHVHRWAYDYSKPGHDEDFVPQQHSFKRR